MFHLKANIKFVNIFATLAEELFNFLLYPVSVFFDVCENFMYNFGLLFCRGAPEVIGGNVEPVVHFFVQCEVLIAHGLTSPSHVLFVQLWIILYSLQ